MTRSLLVSILAAAGSIASVATVVHADTPVLLSDINTTPPSNTASSAPSHIVDLGTGRWMFVALGDGDFNWYGTDGTAAGTVKLRSGVPFFGGGPSVGFSPLGANTVLNGVCYFFADDDVNGNMLWRSDGTVAGTALVKATNTPPGSANTSATNPNLFPVTSQAPDFDFSSYGLGSAGSKVLFGSFVSGSVGSLDMPYMWKSSGIGNATQVFDPNTLLPVRYPDYITNIAGIGPNGANKALVLHGPSGTGPGNAPGTQRWGVYNDADGTFTDLLFNTAAPSDPPVYAPFTGSGIRPVVSSDGYVYFCGTRGSLAASLYRWNGTQTAGVNAVEFVYSPPFAGRIQFPLMEAGGKILMTGANTSSGALRELFIVDPSPLPANPATVSVILPPVTPAGQAGFPRNPIKAGNKVYFSFMSDGLAIGANQPVLWETDGTAAGTVRSLGVPSALKPTLGTVPVQSTGTNGGSPTTGPRLAVANGRLFFAGGLNLTSTGASPGQTAAGNIEPWAWTIGGPVPTVEIIDVVTGALSGQPRYFTAGSGANANNVLFNAGNGATGLEPGISDGTPTTWTLAPAGALVTNIGVVTSDSDPASFTQLNSTTAVFTAIDATGNRNMFRTDGTIASTSKIPGTQPSANSLLESDIANGKVYYGGFSATGGYEVYSTDGSSAILSGDLNGIGDGFPVRTADGGVRAGGRPGFSADRFQWSTGGAILNGAFYYAGRDLDNTVDPTLSTGRELYSTNGSLPTLVKDIYVGVGSVPTPNTPFSAFGANDTVTNGGYGFIPNTKFFAFNGKLYFAASDGVVGNEDSPVGNLVGGGDLYVSDGTAAGTDIVRDAGLAPIGDINAGLGGSEPHSFVRYDATSFIFVASTDGTANDLFRCVQLPDGSHTITQLTFLSGTGSIKFWDPIVVNGKIYFQADDGINGPEVWVCDGTNPVFAPLSDVRTGPVGSLPGPFVALGTDCLFYANAGDDQGFRWFKTDGTTVTALPKLNTITTNNDGPASGALPAAALGEFGAGVGIPTAIYDGLMYVNGNDGISGAELWKTDGLTWTLAADINVGAGSSDPQGLKVINNVLYFSAIRDLATGREPFAITPPPACIGLADVASDGLDTTYSPNGSVGPEDLDAFIAGFIAENVAVADIASDGLDTTRSPNGSVGPEDLDAFIAAFIACS